MSDRVGRPLVVLPGALLAAVGTVVLLVSHEPGGLLLGRLVVGLGAGLTFGAGTAWCADLGGAAGTVLAGVFLTSGFAVGPLVSGVLAQVGPAPLRWPFVVSLLLSVGAVVLAAVASVPETRRRLDAAAGRPRPAVDPVHSARAAMAWSLPVGLVVFASPTITIVTLPPRLPAAYDGPLLVGVAAILALGTGILVQAVARRRAWGPRAGVAGAAASAAGFAVTAAAGAHLGLPAFALVCVLMGVAYGLCLREGLLDVETLAPPERRGTLTGIYYVVTYLGFGVPLLLVAVRPVAGVVVPALVLAAIALAVALTRVVQLRGGHPARTA